MTSTLPKIDRCPVIMTKYLGPTNTRGARVKATAGGAARRETRTVVIAWDDELSIGENHAAAAAALAAKLWQATPDQFTLRGGCHDGCDGFAWTFNRID